MRRGFTLIEVTLVIALTAALLVPFFTLALSAYRESHVRKRLLEARSEAREIAFRIRHRAALAGGLSLRPDNHGLDFSDGSKVYWNESGLWERRPGQNETLLSTQVLDFVVIERYNKTWLTLTLKFQGASRQRDYRSTWEAQ